MRHSKLIIFLFFIRGKMSHSPHLEESGRFDLCGNGHGISVEAVLP